MSINSFERELIGIMFNELTRKLLSIWQTEYSNDTRPLDQVPLNGQANALRKAIQKAKVGGTLSTDTIKKILKAEEFVPQLSTRDIIARFLDYNGWRDFEEQKTEEQVSIIEAITETQPTNVDRKQLNSTMTEYKLKRSFLVRFLDYNLTVKTCFLIAVFFCTSYWAYSYVIASQNGFTEKFCEIPVANTGASKDPTIMLLKEEILEMQKQLEELTEKTKEQKGVEKGFEIKSIMNNPNSRVFSKKGVWE